MTHLNYSVNLIGGSIYGAGALFSYEDEPEEVIIRVGVSFVSTDQACANAEQEVGSSSFDDIVAQSKALWNEKLKNFEIDIAGTPENVTEMLYSSLYRASLTPVSNLSSLLVTALTCHRTTPLARLKECLPTRVPHTLIHCTAGS